MPVSNVASDLASHFFTSQVFLFSIIYIMMLPFIVYGAALLDHALIGAGFDEGAPIGNIHGQCCYYSNNLIL